MEEIDERWYFLGAFVSFMCYLLSYLMLHSGGYFLRGIGVQLIVIALLCGIAYEYLALRIAYNYFQHERKLLYVLTSIFVIILIFMPIVFISIIPKIGLGPGSPENPANIPISPPHMDYAGMILLDMAIFGLLPFILGLIGFLVKKHRVGKKRAEANKEEKVHFEVKQWKK